MSAETVTCDYLARVWPDLFPRPDSETTANNGRMVRKFGRDFAFRDPASIDAAEAREWLLANLHQARYVRSMIRDFSEHGPQLVAPEVAARWLDQRLPKPSSEPIVVPTTEQIDTLVALARSNGEHSLASRIDFAATVGLRFAEQQAVLLPGALTEKGNPLLDAGGCRLTANFAASPRRLQIDWQKARTGALKRPKTKRGVRKAIVPERAQLAFEEALRHRRAGAKGVFLWPESRDTHHRTWSALRRGARIWFKWHNLRHYCATWLLDNGATVDDVAFQLGIRPEEVRDTYGHPNADLALDRLEGLLE